MAQDDYYYEIQLTNKQLVFYFMAGAAGLIVSFLAGVMVGRGVDSSGGEARTRTVAEERIVPEESPSAKPMAPPAEDLTYAQRLEGDKVDDSMKPSGTPLSAAVANAKPRPSPAAAKPTPASPRPSPPPATEPAKPLESPGPVKPSPKPSPAASPKAPREVKGATPPAGFTIQVGAFKDRATAESVVSRLKGKGFAAYLVTPEGDSSLFNVRVGSYPARADAERVEIRLRDEEKFKPFIVKN